MTDLEKTLKLISDASDRLTQSYDYQRGVLDERARCAEQANTIEELRAANERWVIAFNQAEERAIDAVKTLQADNAKLRKTLEQIAYGGTGVPYGYFDEPLRAYELQRLAIAALQETER